MKTLILNNFTMDKLSIDEEYILKKDDDFTHIIYHEGLIDTMLNHFHKESGNPINKDQFLQLSVKGNSHNTFIKALIEEQIANYQSQLKDVEDDLIVGQSMIDLLNNGDSPHSSSHMIFVDHGNVTDKRNIYDLETRVTLSNGSVDNQGSFMDMSESGPSDTDETINTFESINTIESILDAMVDNGFESLVVVNCNNCDDKDNCPNYNDLSDDNVGDDDNLSGVVPGQRDVDGGYSDMKD